jgi:hypothetical protein
MWQEGLWSHRELGTGLVTLDISVCLFELYISISTIRRIISEVQMEKSCA